MNATKCSAARAGLVVYSVLAVVLTGCRTHVVHERTVYVPAPPAPVVEVPPAPAPQPPPPVVVTLPPEQPPVVVIRSENDFYEPLAPYGHWEVVGSYGRCWVPARVEAGWRPYANGYWQRTDAGWYWASDEPWGWATYHYGRWDFHTRLGWIWIPQTQWAPAWVAWREGGGYVGWAPLRPSFSLNLRIGTAVREPAFAPRDFVFVEHRRMLEPVRPKTVIVNNTTIINKTVNITNVKVVNKTVINEGPRAEVIERESGRKVQAVPVREVRHREETAVVARERNIPTARDRKIQPPARVETQPAEKQVVTPSVATPARPTAPPVETGKPARVENRPEADTAKKTATPPPTVEPKAKSEVKAPQPVLPGRGIRPVEKPAVTARPKPQPVAEKPIHDEKKRETAIENRVTPAPPAAETESKNELRSPTRSETKPTVKAEAPPAAVKKQTAPPTGKPANKRLLSPKEKSRAAEQAEGNRKMKEDKSPKKKGQDQEAAIPSTNSPAPQ